MPWPCSAAQPGTVIPGRADAQGAAVISSPDDVTAAVLAEVERARDPRTRELLAAAVRHLHAFVRETRLTEAEFQRIAGIVARLGQLTSESHNEVVLIVRSPTPGDPIFVTGCVVDADGRPVAGAEVDVWNTSGEGLYENQDPRQAEMNLRGTFVTDSGGRFSFRTVKPAGYPIPVNGPVGDLLRAQGRHNMRPAHIHFLISKPGYKTQFSQVYASDDANLETDAQFGVTAALVGSYVQHDTATEPAPDPGVTGTWHSLEHRFVIEPGDSSLPKPPITGKATGDVPVQEFLEREP